MLKEQEITDYEIEETNYGFITDDPVIFIAGYRYICDGSEEVYGYKLRMNDDQTFSVIEEGVQVGKFIMGSVEAGD